MSNSEQIPLDFDRKRTGEELRQSILEKRKTGEPLDEEEKAMVQEETDFDSDERRRTGSV